MDMKFEVLMAVTEEMFWDSYTVLYGNLSTLEMEASDSSKSIPQLFLVTFHYYVFTNLGI